MRRQSIILAGVLGLMIGVGGLCVWRAAGGAQQAAGGSQRLTVSRERLESRNTSRFIGILGKPEHHAPRTDHHVSRITHHALDYELIARRNLFRPLVAKRRISESANRRITLASARALALPPLRPLIPSPLPPLPFRMAGMIDTGRTPVALLEEVNTGRYQAVKAGDKVADIEVVRVEAEQVIVNAAGAMRTLPLQQGESQAAANRERAPNVQLEKRIIPDSEQ